MVKQVVGIWDFTRIGKKKLGNFAVFLMNVKHLAATHQAPASIAFCLDNSRKPPRDVGWTWHQRFQKVELSKLVCQDPKLIWGRNAMAEHLASLDDTLVFPEDLTTVPCDRVSASSLQIWFKDSIPKCEVPRIYMEMMRTWFADMLPKDRRIVGLNLRCHPQQRPVRNAHWDTWQKVISESRRLFPDVLFVQFGDGRELDRFNFGFSNQVRCPAKFSILEHCALMSLVDFTVMNGGGTDYIAHAIHAPTMSWADMTIAGRDHPDRIHPRHGLSPKYLLPTQQHFPKQHPSVDEVLQELEKRLEKQPI